MSATRSRPIKVATTNDIEPGRGRAFEVGRRSIAIFNVDGHFHAIDNTCCHRAGPLADGWLEGTVVACPLHLWRYDITTGACLSVEGERVDRFDLEIVGDEIHVRL